MSIANLTHSLPDVANHFHVEPIEVSRWAALGFINVDIVDDKQCVLHDNLVAAIPRLSTVPMGIRRGPAWFDSVHIPKGKNRFKNAVKDAAESQMLSQGEVAARANSRTKSIEIELLHSPEISQATQAEWIGGIEKKIRESTGSKTGYWQPPNVRTAYVADCLVQNVKRTTAANLANLYASKPEFEKHVSGAVSEFLNGYCSFTEVVQTATLNVAVIYSLANRSAFNQEQVQRVAGWIF